MIRFAFLLLVLNISVYVNAQINSAYFNRAQWKIYCDRFDKYEVKGFITTEFKSQNDFDKKSPKFYYVVFLDTLGQRILEARFDKEKVRLSFTQYEFDSLGRNIREINHYNKSDSVSGFDENFYDNKGELVETVQHGALGAINSKTINYYDANGFIDRKEVIGPDGRLTFNTSIVRNHQGYPIQTELKSLNGFVMNRLSIRYLRDDLPKVMTSFIGITGKSTKSNYEFDNNGNLILTRGFTEGKLSSIEVTEYFYGEMKDQLRERGFDLTSLEVLSKVNAKNVFYFKNLASFPGGDEALKNYLRKNIVFSSKINDQGMVIISFAIDVNGKIIDIKVDRGLSKSLDEKAIEVVEKMPNWIPAQLSNGKPHKSTTSVGILFLKK